MGKRWSREESRERFSGPISPLGWSLLRAPTEATLAAMNRRFGVRVAEPEEVAARIGGYVYARKSLFRNLSAWRFRPAALVVQVLKAIAFGFWSSVRGLGAVLGRRRSFREEAVFSFVTMFSRNALRDFLSSWDREWVRLQEGMARDPVDSSHEMTFAEFERCREIFETETRKFFAEDFTVYFYKNFLASLLRSSLRGRNVGVDEAERLTRLLTQGLAANYSVKMALDIARGLPADQALARYGHLTDDWDLSQPIFAERPEIFEVRSPARDLEADFQKRSQERQETQRKLKAEFRDPRWDFFVDAYQKCVLIDEDLRALSSRQYPALKKLFRGVAASAVWRETALDEKDLYCLTLQEIREGLRRGDFSAFVAGVSSRKDELERAKTANPPDELEETAPGRYRVLSENLPTRKGQGVSSGRVRGPALPVRTFEDLKRLTPSHVLILTNPTPVYAAYYASCAGLLSETGGSLSHGAIVAREFGIPMVTGLPNALKDIAEGTVIEIDGDSGEVRVIG